MSPMKNPNRLEQVNAQTALTTALENSSESLMATYPGVYCVGSGVA